MKKKTPATFECIEKTGLFAQFFKTKELAWAQLQKDYPDETQGRSIDELTATTLSKCLDCESYWTGNDGCGECGEDRLSKRYQDAWYLEYK